MSNFKALYGVFVVCMTALTRKSLPLCIVVVPPSFYTNIFYRDKVTHIVSRYVFTRTSFTGTKLHISDPGTFLHEHLLPGQSYTYRIQVYFYMSIFTGTKLYISDPVIQHCFKNLILDMFQTCPWL